VRGNLRHKSVALESITLKEMDDKILTMSPGQNTKITAQISSSTNIALLMLQTTSEFQYYIPTRERNFMHRLAYWTQSVDGHSTGHISFLLLATINVLELLLIFNLGRFPFYLNYYVYVKSVEHNLKVSSR
jgi:hypothetical protein